MIRDRQPSAPLTVPAHSVMSTPSRGRSCSGSAALVDRRGGCAGPRDAAVALERPALSSVAGCLHVAAIVVGMWQLYL
jgi:hypothetical protein